MSYLLDIFNKRQPMPELSGPQQMPTQMPAMPSGGPNQPTQMPAFAALDLQQGTLPPMDVATAIACGIPPSQINRGPGGNAQNNPLPNIDFSGGMGGVSQMPAFQPPQPMPFNNRPMPQFGAPNFSLQGGMIGAPQPSPMNGMMKGMFGVR